MPVKVGAGHPEQVHVRARVLGAQHAIDVESVSGTVGLEALRQHDLERVPGPDVFLGHRHSREVVVFSGAAAETRGGLQIEVVHRLRIFGEKVRCHFLDSAHGIVVGSRGTFGAAVKVDGVGDDPHHAVPVVQHGQVSGQQHCSFWHTEFVGVGVGQPFPAAHHVVADDSHHAAGQRRQAGHTLGGQHLQRLGQQVLRRPTRGETDGRATVPTGALAVGLVGKNCVAAHPNEAVSRPTAALFSRFKQERARA